ncbi:MAG: winged helix-turn-helix transcriptional regulator [Victivallales bacterium]|nr:winged helix-turn-helix transcriptional regulator [Victivallales bacterium]
MIRDKCRETADHRVVDTMTIADLNQDTLRRYRNLFRQCRPDDLTANADDEEFLCRHGAAKRDEAGVVRPLLASVLMFGDFHSIQEQCPHYFVDYREKLDDNPRYSDRICPFTVGFSGNLFDFYFRVVSRLVADVKTPFKLDKRLLRVDDTPVHKALRECLANTLIHADHTGRRGIVIEKTFRHITFANPGALRLPKDIAIAGGTSDARNDVIFTLFALVEIGEKLGTGLCQLFALWKEHGWPEPELQEQFDPERTLLVLDYNDAEDATQASNAPDNGINTPQKTGIENNDTCDENGGICDENNDICDENSNNCDANGHLIPIARQEEMLLSLISQNPKITQKALSEASGLSARTVFSRLNNLQKSNRIRRVGPDKGGHWEVLNS